MARADASADPETSSTRPFRTRSSMQSRPQLARPNGGARVEDGFADAGARVSSSTGGVSPASIRRLRRCGDSGDFPGICGAGGLRARGRSRLPRREGRGAARRRARLTSELRPAAARRRIGGSGRPSRGEAAPRPRGGAQGLGAACDSVPDRKIPSVSVRGASLAAKIPRRTRPTSSRSAVPVRRYSAPPVEDRDQGLRRAAGIATAGDRFDIEAAADLIANDMQHIIPFGAPGSSSSRARDDDDLAQARDPARDGPARPEAPRRCAAARGATYFSDELALVGPKEPSSSLSPPPGVEGRTRESSGSHRNNSADQHNLGLRRGPCLRR